MKMTFFILLSLAMFPCYAESRELTLSEKQLIGTWSLVGKKESVQQKFVPGSGFKYQFFQDGTGFRYMGTELKKDGPFDFSIENDVLVMSCNCQPTKILSISDRDMVVQGALHIMRFTKAGSIND